MKAGRGLDHTLGRKVVCREDGHMGGKSGKPCRKTPRPAADLLLGPPGKDMARLAGLLAERRDRAKRRIPADLRGKSSSWSPALR